jgi:hypothetical protein
VFIIRWGRNIKNYSIKVRIFKFNPETKTLRRVSEFFQASRGVITIN